MIEIIGTVLAALLTGSLFKAKLYCIWIKKATGAWECPNPGGNSARRCRKAVAVMVDHGVPYTSIEILPKGVKPI
jgi:hypothetical protein